MTLYSANMTIMNNAVQLASRSLLRDYREVSNLQTSLKGPGDFVSAADRNSERILVEELMKARPGYSIITEESPPTETESEFRWIIDPLDGSFNFLHSIPYFAISVALYKLNVPVAAIVYDPIQNETFWAEEDKGAFLNNRRIKVSARKSLTNIVVAHAIPPADLRQKQLKLRFMTRTNLLLNYDISLRRFGAASLDMSYVAAGRLDAFFANNLCPWDVAAAVFIISQAGGKVSDVYDDDKNLLDYPDLIASNAKLHDPLRSLLKLK